MTLIQQAVDKKRLYFMGGMPRSGTTWLRNLLGSDERVFFTAELHLFDHYICKLTDSYDRVLLSESSRGLNALFNEREFYDRLIAPFASTVVSTLREAAPASCEIVLEKTPANLLHWRMAMRLFPEAKFIVARRDPRAVCASFKAASVHEWGSWAKKPIEKVMISWLNYESILADLSSRHPERVQIVNYEELQEKQVEVLKKLWHFAGLEIEAERLEQIYFDNHIDRQKDLPSSDPRHMGLPGFYRRGLVDSWKDELDSEELDDIYRICLEAGIYLK